MQHHYLLWASGPDKSGIVFAVTKQLFRFGVNLEDSSMMRLGAEFGIFLIFSAKNALDPQSLTRELERTAKRQRLSIGVKKISAREAKSRRPSTTSHIISVYGPDRPGIVYKVTSCLAKRGFNISDLSTHRTSAGKKAGYILLIEGNVPGKPALAALRRDFQRIQKTLKTKIDIRAVEADPL